jgi:tripartite-type tricarboxylate transporter receptor subunit TctC
MTFRSSRFIAISLFAAACAPSALAQSFPSKPVRIVSPFAAGGQSDQVLRVLGDGLAPRIGQSVLIDPRPGGGGLVAALHVKGEAPDGHTLLQSGNSAAIQSARPNATIDLLKDFVLVAPFTRSATMIAVNSGLPVRSFKELIDYARANPGKLNYGSYGIGSAGHLQMEVMLLKTGVRMVTCPTRAPPPRRSRSAAAIPRSGSTRRRPCAPSSSAARCASSSR